MAPLRRKSQMKTSAASASTPYFQMIRVALSSLKDRNGSNHAAIARFLQESYGEQIPLKFDKILSAQLKKSVNSQKLVKIGNSYKICPAGEEEKLSGDDYGDSEAAGKMKRLSQIHTPEALQSKKKKA